MDAVLAAVGPYLEVASASATKRAVVAIDFGSTHSGYAYALSGPDLEGVPDALRANVVSPVYKNRYYKQPTSILFERETEEIIAFGFDAEEQYVALLDRGSEEKRANVLFFNGANIKMRLWNHGGMQQDIPCTTVDGNDSLPLMTVISGVLKVLKNQVLERLEANSGIEFPASEVLWVVTVPAIWEEPDKQFMRRSAFQAGLILEPASTDLILALEPECASIAMYKDSEDPLPLEVDDKILTLDCGGGTCDVGSVQVLTCNEDYITLRQLLEPSGDNWGAVNVDWRFFLFIGELTGDIELVNTRARHPVAIMELKELWNTLKVTLAASDFEKGAAPQTINVSSLFSLLELNLKDKVAEFNKSCHKEFRLGSKGRSKNKHTMLLIPPLLLESFFEPVISSILQHTETLLATEALEDLKYVVLVGGFGECKLLQSRLDKLIKEKSDTATLKLPKRSSSAVVTGAVKYGLQPAIISTRRARMTIGVKVTMPLSMVADPKHRSHRAYQVFNEERQEVFVRNCFKPFVVKGQEVDSTEEVVHPFSTLRPDWTTVKFDIYSTTRKKVLHTTERGCTRLAQLVIDIDPVEKESLNTAHLVCAMRFAATEITAEVVDLRTGKNQRLLLQYDNMGLRGAKGTKGTFLHVPVSTGGSTPFSEIDFDKVFNFDDGESGFL